MSDPFVLFWHRYGNTRAGLEAVHQAAAAERSLGERPVAQGVELDLKWTPDGARPLLYAYHGPTGRERLRAKAVARRASQGHVVSIPELFSEPAAARLHYLVEIKCGHGPAPRALEALAELVDAQGLSEQVWLAASSLDMLDAARAAAPTLRRVLFGAPLGSDQVLHKPTTYILRSLLRHGLRHDPRGGPAEILCPLGLRPASPAGHERAAEASRVRGLGYLPGRVVDDATLEALARAGHPGAFVYAKL